MKEYNGFKYEMKSEGKWKIVFPGGHKTVMDLTDETAVKAKIDELISQFGG